ncbi:hypothetical protein DFJ67_5098 [Asanoa ferruginea]|uniref:Uncharacterized protein n=1 Tax=Asanoa ferruginea TaxID=53367 RepID=A0A3D9ZRG5_9ACTN|nr:integrase [Asanoa ferruginea]REF99072.1 hypothetical protein DFJ67_5098 [Asanoa ferruginea]GIF51364.1 hypothetical protein Afe04nite_59030 [Asanoa ferruginea]
MRIRLRHLRIGAQTFTWRAVIGHLPGNGDCHRWIRVRVWGAGKTSQALQADLLSVTGPSPWSACATDGGYPTPSDVRAIVDYALTVGWRPAARGGTFVLSEREHAARFSLPGFILTDRKHSPEAADPTARVKSAYEARARSLR